MSTQQFSYDIVESPYGPKLAVEFDYDPDIISALKRLSWSRTQTIGRVLRPSGGRQARIVDVIDRGRFFQEAYEDRQQTVTDYYELEDSPTTETPLRAVA